MTIIPTVNPDSSRPDSDTTPTRPLVPWLIAAIVLLLVGGLLGYWLGRAPIPAADSVEVGFARDMSIHHEQAVAMAALAYDRSDNDAVRSLAFDILTTQQGQIGIMTGWLDAWGLPLTSAGPRMGWMGMPMTGLMPGMATAEQMAALRAATGPEADTLFLQLMIPHHRSGMEMAQYVADRTRNESIRRFTAGMAAAQALEITYMEELLKGIGAEPPPADAGSHNHG